MQPLKAWIGWKQIEEEEILWAVPEAKLSLDEGLKHLKVIGRGKDWARKRVPVIIGINDLKKELVRFLSILTANVCWAFENLVFLKNKAFEETIG